MISIMLSIIIRIGLFSLDILIAAGLLDFVLVALNGNAAHTDAY